MGKNGVQFELQSKKAKIVNGGFQGSQSAIILFIAVLGLHTSKQTIFKDYLGKLANNKPYGRRSGNVWYYRSQ